MTELAARGHAITAYEPAGAWSAANLVETEGEEALQGFRECYPDLNINVYDPNAILLDHSLDRYLDGIDLAIVHEWNEPALVAAVGRVRMRSRELRVLFHDTHHRSVTAPGEMAHYELQNYDGVLAFGESVRAQYQAAGWGDRAWTWHEAADTRVFYPRLPENTGAQQSASDHRIHLPSPSRKGGVRRQHFQSPGRLEGDLVWIGNWGDDERSAELRTFLIDPVRELKLRARVYGVRYPPHAQAELGAAGIVYQGWLPNYLAPEVYAHFRMTIHVPRRPYAKALPGVPTIRVFEALACGIPLISAPWMDSENLFGDGCFLRVSNGEEAKQAMRSLRDDPALGAELAQRGLEVIWNRHTCAHRVDELMEVYERIKPGVLAEAVQ